MLYFDAFYHSIGSNSLDVALPQWGKNIFEIALDYNLSIKSIDSPNSDFHF